MFTLISKKTKKTALKILSPYYEASIESSWLLILEMTVMCLYKSFWNCANLCNTGTSTYVCRYKIKIFLLDWISCLRKFVFGSTRWSSMIIIVLDHRSFDKTKTRNWNQNINNTQATINSKRVKSFEIRYPSQRSYDSSWLITINRNQKFGKEKQKINLM